MYFCDKWRFEPRITRWSAQTLALRYPIFASRHSYTSTSTSGSTTTCANSNANAYANPNADAYPAILCTCVDDYATTGDTICANAYATNCPINGATTNQHSSQHWCQWYSGFAKLKDIVEAKIVFFFFFVWVVTNMRKINGSHQKNSAFKRFIKKLIVIFDGSNKSNFFLH